ncbi:MAG: Hsp70 family protein, partial [Ruminococcus sp.]|nr:Hsp70 family protein [Ruminococcus sp.]
LGTCNSVVSYAGSGKPEALKFVNGDKGEIMPSAVFFNAPGECTFGRNALQKGRTYCQSLATLFKRRIADDNFKYHIKYASSGKATEAEDYRNTSFIIDSSVFCEDEFILGIVSEVEDFHGKIYIPDCVKDNLRALQNDSDICDKVTTALENIEKFSDSEFYSVALCFGNDEINEMFSEKTKDLVHILRKNPDFVLVTNDSIVADDINGLGENFRIWNSEEWKNNLLSCANAGNDESLEISPAGVAEKFLRNIRKLASEKIKANVSNVVITVPASFDFRETDTVINVCRAAGFSRVEIEREPIAAGIRYFMNATEKKYILVYDFGGGTFDTSIISVTPNPESIFKADFKIEGSAGDAELGGDDITRLILKEVYDNVFSEYNLNMSSQEESGLSAEQYQYNENKLYDVCEKCKIALSDGFMEDYSIDVDIYTDDNEKIHYSYLFRLSTFENLINVNIVPKVNKCLEQVINENYGDISKDEISDVLLVGGTSSIRILQENVEKFFGKKPINDGNLATLVSEGAAMEAYMYSEKAKIINVEEIPVIPVTKTTLKNYGIGLDNFRMDIIAVKGSELPLTVSKKYAISKDNPKGITFGLYSFTENNITTEDNYSVLNNDVVSVATINITELPAGLKQQDTFVNVDFCLSENYTLVLTASLSHEDGSMIEDGRTVKAELTSV